MISVTLKVKPSFLTVKHEIEGTFPKIQSELKKLVELRQSSKINMRVFYRNLGEMIHYIADYFTFPHNATFTGNLKDHCIYEKHLKDSLKDYIQSGEAEQNQPHIRKSMQNLNSPEAICNFIRKQHEAYIKLKNTVEEDCRQIVALCHQVVEAVLLIVE